jgi:hypothetical protein
MKKLYFLPNLLKFSFIALLLTSTLFVFSSCKDEAVDPFEDVTIQFKVIATPSVVMKAIVTQVGVDQNQNLNVMSNTYTSVPQIVNTSIGALHLASTATGTAADSKLTIQILVNGQVRAEKIVEGSTELVANTSYTFIN